MVDLRVANLRQDSRPTDAAPVLRIQALTARAGIRRVIEGFSLDVYAGDQLCLSGPNGSGKSTLLNALAGLEPARIEAGRITFAGRDVTSSPAHERARLGLGYLRQRDNVFADLAVEENLRLAIGSGGLASFREAFPAWAADLAPRTRVGLLSGGQRQRLAWAMATLRPSGLLLLDEPEAGMADRPSLPPGATCILVTHSPASWATEDR